MGNTETFELCATSSKKQCPDWEIGIVYCSCGRCLTPSQRTKKLDKKNFDALSIPGYATNKNLLRGAKHGASGAATNVLQSQGHVTESSPTQAWRYKSILEKWHNNDKYRESLSKMGGVKNKLFSMTKLHWKITPILQQEEKDIGMIKVR